MHFCGAVLIRVMDVNVCLRRLSGWLRGWRGYFYGGARAGCGSGRIHDIFMKIEGGGGATLPSSGCFREAGCSSAILHLNGLLTEQRFGFFGQNF